jgi:tocopherol O-methyltransferase
MATAAVFTVSGFEDVSRRLTRTWSICAGRLLKALLSDRETRRVALGARNGSTS